MKVSSLAVLCASSAYAAPADDGPCCTGDDSQAAHESCQTWMVDNGRPACLEDEGFKSANNQCPNFCDANPFDWSCTQYASRGTRNKHLVPFGATAGDFVFNATGKYYTQQNIGPITWQSDFSGQQYDFAFISGHGFVRLSKTDGSGPADSSKPGDYFNYYRTLQQQQAYTDSYAMIAPYWGDFDLRKGGYMSYRIMDKKEIPKMFSEYGYDKPTDRKVKTVMVVTWHKVKATKFSSSKVESDYEITFQVVLAQCSKGDFFISYNFGDIEQDGFMYMKSDACGVGGNGWSQVGFAGANEVWSHPFSNTDRADNVDDTSNCGINGRWNLALIKGNLLEAQVTGENVTLKPIKPSVDISTGHQGTHEAMISGGDHPMLDNHGCHCGSGDQFFGGASSMDAVDALCKQWKAAKACLEKLNGECNGFGEGTYSVSADIKTCYSKKGCPGATCSVDTHFLALINDEINNGWVPKKGNMNVCTQGPMGDYNDSCCGEAPFLQAYNQNKQKCKNGEVQY